MMKVLLKLMMKINKKMIYNLNYQKILIKFNLNNYNKRNCNINSNKNSCNKYSNNRSCNINNIQNKIKSKNKIKNKIIRNYNNKKNHQDRKIFHGFFRTLKFNKKMINRKI